MKLIPFTHDPQLIQRFVRFPDRLHAGNGAYIPPFTHQMKRRFDPRHSFYQYGETQNFILTSEGEILGRVSAMVNPRSKFGDRPSGYIGYFESVEDNAVGECLVNAAIGYLAKKKLKQVYAPVNFSTWYEYRFLVDGFGHQPFPLEPFNPPYYPEFFTTMGFRQTSSYRSAMVTDPRVFIDETAHLVESFLQSGYSMRRMRARRIADYRLLYDLTISIFQNNYGFSNIGKKEFMDLHAGNRMAIGRDNILFALNPQKQPIGFIVTIPNYYAALQAMNGKASAATFLRFVKERKKADTLVIKTLGVLPGLRHVVPGHVLLAGAYRGAVDNGYTRLVQALMREGSPSMRIDKSADTNYKKYALFVRDLTNG